MREEGLRSEKVGRISTTEKGNKSQMRNLNLILDKIWHNIRTYTHTNEEMTYTKEMTYTHTEALGLSRLRPI